MIEQNTRRLHVRNIPVDWDDWRLFHVFRKLGRVANVIIPKLRTEQCSNYRYGFVDMLDASGIKSVVANLDSRGFLLVDGLNRPLEVQFAHGKSEINHVRATSSQEEQQNVLRSVASESNSDVCVSSSLSAENSEITQDFLRSSSIPQKPPCSATLTEHKAVAERVMESRMAQSKLKLQTHRRISLPSPKQIRWSHRFADLPLRKDVKANIRFMWPQSGGKLKHLFYVVPVENQVNLSSAIFEESENIGALEKDPKIDDIVIVGERPFQDRKAYRARILRLTDDSAHVINLDTAQVAHVPISMIRRYPKSLYSLPFQAIPCMLAGVSNAHPSIMNKLTEIIDKASSDFDVRARAVAFEGSVNLIQLYLVKASVMDGISIRDVAEELHNLGFCDYKPCTEQKIVYTRDTILSLRNTGKNVVPVLNMQAREVLIEA
ncbi:hypothetical protein AB6A40_002941 [Gnathostoma spinigerum]|uniref:RRM domain-containing protein n=1 Tax=Gnathostoma spinigerum TaxID=75299 RepID=A0ABD6EHS6_9BILA